MVRPVTNGDASPRIMVCLSIRPVKDSHHDRAEIQRVDRQRAILTKERVAGEDGEDRRGARRRT